MFCVVGFLLYVSARTNDHFTLETTYFEVRLVIYEAQTNAIAIFLFYFLLH